MKKRLFSCVLVGFIASLAIGCNFPGIGENNNGISQSGNPILILKKEFPAASVREVNAATSGGNIHITGDATDQAFVEVYTNGHLAPEEALQEVLKRFTLVVSADNGLLTVSAKPKTGLHFMGHNPSVSFQIHVPRAVATHLTTSGGNISVAALNGNHYLRTSGGNLTLDSLSGNMDGSTNGGNIRVNTLVGSSVKLNTSGGNIEGKLCKGSDIVFTTSGGSVDLQDIIGGHIKAETSGGNIAARGISGSLDAETSGGNLDLQNINGSLKGSTSGGNIEASFLAAKDFIQLKNSGGDITVSLPASVGAGINLAGENVRLSSLQHFEGNTSRGKASGNLNGGGFPIDIRTNGGSVNFNLK